MYVPLSLNMAIVLRVGQFGSFYGSSEENRRYNEPCKGAFDF